MKATLRPRRESATAEYAAIELIARTGNHKITIRHAGRVYAVERFYLYGENRRARLTDAELAALPWQGKGPDPDAAATPLPAGAAA